MIVGIYAPKPNMGASTLAQQLALVLASSAESVLLVELDYRYPSMAIRWQLSDRDRSLERAVSDYIWKPGWRLQDYMLPCRDDSTRNIEKLPPNLNLLVPSGLRGFETFPAEPSSFVDELLAQARNLAHAWTIMDISSDMDSALTLSALKRAEICILLDDGDRALEPILHQRMELWKCLGLCSQCIRVQYRIRSGSRILKQIHPLPPPAAVFPYVRRMARQELSRCRSRTYQKSLKRLIQSLRERRENG